MLQQTQLKFSRSHEGLEELPKHLGRKGENEDQMKAKSDLSGEIQFSSTEQLKTNEQIGKGCSASLTPSSSLPPDTHYFPYAFSTAIGNGTYDLQEKKLRSKQVGKYHWQRQSQCSVMHMYLQLNRSLRVPKPIASNDNKTQQTPLNSTVCWCQEGEEHRPTCAHTSLPPH